jgi:hypothetical protein
MLHREKGNTGKIQQKQGYPLVIYGSRNYLLEPPFIDNFPMENRHSERISWGFPYQNLECGNFPWHHCTVQLQAVRQIAPTGQ